MNSVNVNKRESSFELIRIIAQYMIVLYHILLTIVYPYTNLPFFKAIWLPLHIGVPLFVLISGYFGIKADVKRLIVLLGIIFVLQVPLEILDTFRMNGGVKDYLGILFFVSNTPFWFIRTYFFLFLFSPIINYYLKNITDFNRIVLLAILFILSHYEGTLGFDPSLIEGYCLTTFLFFYVLGDTLHHYKERWLQLPSKVFMAVFLIYNTIIVVFFTLYGDQEGVAFIYTRFFFSYQSIGLLISSILFFMAIGGLKIQSKLINRIGKSSLAIYMLHGSNQFINVLLPPFVISICSYVEGNVALSMGLIMILSFIITIVCWWIYELLTPIWKLVGKMGDSCQNKYYLFKKKMLKLLVSH